MPTSMDEKVVTVNKIFGPIKARLTELSSSNWIYFIKLTEKDSLGDPNKESWIKRVSHLFEAIYDHRNTVEIEQNLNSLIVCLQTK